MGEESNRQQEQDLGQLLKVRREKLAALQEKGKDPFQIVKYDVTHHSMDIKERGNGREKRICGGAYYVQAYYGESFLL